MIIRVPESAGGAAPLYERIQYPAGELQVRLPKSTIRGLFASPGRCTCSGGLSHLMGLDEHDAGCPVGLTGPRVTVICRNAHMNLMELSLLADAIHHELGCVDSTLVLPYLPYARADRRFVEGDCHGLKTFGEIIDQMHFNRVRTLDVHSFRAKKFVHKLEDVSPRPFISRAIADICDNGGHPVVLLPDEGASRYGLKGALQCSKKRDAATGKLSGFEVPSREEIGDHDMLIVDDICDGGGTFTGLAEALQDKVRIGCMCPNPRGLKHCPKHGGVKNKLYLYVTHGIFSRGFAPLLKYFEKIYTTNSFHTCSEPECHDYGPRMKVFDCEAELLGEVK